MQAMTYDFGAESAFLMKPTQADCDIKVRRTDTSGSTD